MSQNTKMENLVNFIEPSQKLHPTRPLLLAEAGKKVKIASIEGGHPIQSRLAALGLFPNVEVQILNRPRGGPLLVMVKGSRLALGRGLSSMIMVEETHSLVRGEP